MSENIKLSCNENGVAQLVFDLDGEKVNKLSFEVMSELRSLLLDLSSRSDIRLLVISSAKKNIFIAGADISQIDKIENTKDALKAGLEGQDIMNRIEGLPFPTLAVIDGACLGGGLELALSCTYRIASDNPKTILGLPEVSLGIIPGWGGTQRLPRLVGLQQGLAMILPGKAIPAKKAFKIKLIDAILPHEFLDEGVKKFTQSLLGQNKGASILKKRGPKGWLNALLEKTPPGRSFIYKQARKNLHKKTHGHYPAPLGAISAIERGYDKSLREGLVIEAEIFSELACSKICKNLISIYFTSEALRKESWGYDIKSEASIGQVGVLGAGIMGGGIGWLFTHKGHGVRLKDLNWEAIAKGFESASKAYQSLIIIRKCKSKEANLKMNLLSGTLDFSGFKKLDLVVEAIVENMDIKKKVLAELETEVRDETILCSNTSALSITEMAESLNRPERFLGLHFFNPVNRMPLVEIIPGEKTSPKTMVDTIKLLRTLGKTVVVVGNCTGFLVNRILLPYMNEASLMLQEGSGVEQVDKVLFDFGMPMGPFVLSDEVGIDVGVHVAQTLEEGFGERMKVAEILIEILEVAKLLGKKGGKGFYTYKGKDKEYNPDIDDLVRKVCSGGKVQIHTLSDTDILGRCMMIMINEAARCLEEDVIKSPEYLDMAMIMGTGFPPFRGGLLRYADSLGIPQVVDTLNSYSKRFGDRFKPAELLIKMKEEGRGFYHKL